MVCTRLILSISLFIISTAVVQSGDCFKCCLSKSSPAVLPLVRQKVKKQQQVPRTVVESFYTLDFGDNAFALYEFDGRDNKLTCCYMDEKIYAPVYIEYPDDKTKSYGISEEQLFRPYLCPTYSFDESTSWVVLPQSEVRVYRFAQGHCAFKFNDKGNVVWRSPLLENIKNPILVHPALPCFVECNETGFNIYSTTLFTNPQRSDEKQVGTPESSFELHSSYHIEKKKVPVNAKVLNFLKKNILVNMSHFLSAQQSGKRELVYPHVIWHPTENRLLLKTDDHMFAEYNGDSKKIERKFPARTLWLGVSPHHSAYVPTTQQIVAIGAPAGDLRRLYELRENAEPCQLPIKFVGNTNKTIVYNKIISVVRNYLVLECMFSDNPRFLGVCDMVTNKLYNVHDFRTEEGSIVFDPSTLKFFEMGHRIYFGYPGKCEVYNQECSIVRLELPFSVDSCQ